jgi:hypothetical protein
MTEPRDIPVTAAQVAGMAGVRPSAVSNWRRRHDDFPKPVGVGSRGGDLFSANAIEGWLGAHGYAVRRPQVADRVYALLNGLRGAMRMDDAVDLALRFLLLAGTLEPPDVEHVRRLADTDVERALAELRDLSIGLGGHADGAWAALGAEPALATEMIRETLREMPASERADAFESLVDRGGRSAGGMAGSEHRTDMPLAQLLVALAGPIKGVVVDPAVGAGDVLLAAGRAAQENGDSQTVVLAGEALLPAHAAFASARLALNGLKADVRVENSLADPSLPRGFADIVICDPPWGLRPPAGLIRPDDPRWFAGTPTGSAIDFAWLQHALWLTKPVTGRALVVTVLGATFQSGRADEIRFELLNRGMVEAVIALPPGSAGSRMAAQLAIWILRWPAAGAQRSNVMFADATHQRQSRRDGLDPALVPKLVDCLAAARAMTTLCDHGPVFVGLDQLATCAAVSDWMLASQDGANPQIWVGEPRYEVLDNTLYAANLAFDDLISDALDLIGEAWRKVETFSPEAVPAGEASAPHVLGDLVREGVVECIGGTRIDPDAYAPDGATVATVDAGGKREARFVDLKRIGKDPVLSREGDVLVAPRPAGHAPRVALARSDGEVIVAPNVCLRVTADWLDPILLAASVDVAAGQPRAMATRSVRPWLMSVDVPRLGEEDGLSAAAALRAIDELEERLQQTTRLIDMWRSMSAKGIVSRQVRFARAAAAKVEEGPLGPE